MSFEANESRPVNLMVERLDRGLSHQAAADAMGIARGSLVKAERGEQVTPSIAKAIADFYGYRVTQIWPVEEAA